uniref:Uncharacterized protein n=1 Tax=Sphenodon punctatus TaxID=8508 RepID=A0A8D0GNW8_SPHPU
MLHVIIWQFLLAILDSEDATITDVESKDVVVPENRAVPSNRINPVAGVESVTESHGESSHSTVLYSVLVPICAVGLIIAVVFAVVKFRLLKTSDLVSVGSYRTNISMSEFENAREYGAKDNVCMNKPQETQLGGVDEFITSSGSTEETEEPKKAKRSSKEEADIAYTTFLLHSSNLNKQNSPDGTTA